MASQNTSVDTDADEVKDFLQGIKELGEKHHQEDEDRNRKLEEEIKKGRRERQARREERTRSISPTKSSPANTPPHNPYRKSLGAAETPKFQLSPSRQSTVDDAAERSVNSPPTKEIPQEVPTLSRSTKPGETFETVAMANRDSNPASPVAATPARELSWQRRPKSQASDRPRSRPLSQFATENASAARSPAVSPTRSSADDTVFSRDQIANSLASKDPAFFRQTADRGTGSAAYRKNQVEDTVVADHSLGAQLPGMSGPENGKNMSVRSAEVSPNRSYRSRTMSSQVFNMDGPIGARSPMPMSPAQRLDPPGSDSTFTTDRADFSAVRERSLAMSPTQGRISPERVDRPHSPTKGMGGFVQSAMMKRSDSVNKRWSVQSPQGLNRSDSITSNRNSYHPSPTSSTFGELLKSPPIREPTPLSRDNTPRPLSRPSSRPTSSYGGSNATVIQHEIDRGETPGSIKSSSGANDVFVKPERPTTRSTANSAASSKEDLSLKNDETKPKELELPSSPSRTMDPKRWSPTKSSWLESALNKPDASPKPKTVAAPSQPSWMAEIAKARQKSVDAGVSRNSAPKHEVNIGGLMRSSAMGVPTKPLSLGGLPQGFGTTSSRGAEYTGRGVLNANKTGGGPAGQVDGRSSPRPTSSSSRAERPSSSSSYTSNPGVTSALKSPDLNKSPSPVLSKPEEPPKKDFRSNLSSWRQPPPSSTDKNQAEFKSVFGQLRSTKTQNYVAPDALKDNILRGKSALNVTGGPKKTERVDEFRKSILEKKKDFEKAQLEGKGVARTASNSSREEIIPEAIAKRQTLVLEKAKSTPPSTPPKPISIGNAERSTPEAIVKARTVRDDAPKPSAPLPQKEASAPGRLQGKLADRFNPALAGLLARGPPSASSETSRTSSPSGQRTTSMGTSADMGSEKTSPKLEHVTKGRARGPRRKAPSSLGKSEEGETLPDKTVDAATAVPVANTEIETVIEKPAAVDTAVEAEKTREETKSVPAKAEEIAPEVASNTSQPTSPRKRTMTINRRSRYLEELANKNDKVPEPTKPKSPIKKLNIEDIFQAPASPTKEVAKSPVRKLNHEFLPKSPVKALPDLEKQADVAPEVPPKSPGKITPELKKQEDVVAEVQPKSPLKSPAKSPQKSTLGLKQSLSAAEVPHRSPEKTTSGLKKQEDIAVEVQLKSPQKSPVLVKMSLSEKIAAERKKQTGNAAEVQLESPQKSSQESKQSISTTEISPMSPAKIPLELKKQAGVAPDIPPKSPSKSTLESKQSLFAPKIPPKSPMNSSMELKPSDISNEIPVKSPKKSPNDLKPSDLSTEIPVKSPTKSPMELKPSNVSNESLLKSPSKVASEPEKQADVTAEVKINPISNSNTSTVIKEKPMAPPKSPELTQNALRSTVNLKSPLDSFNSNPEIVSKPVSLNSTAQKSASTRPLPNIPAPINVNRSLPNPLAPITITKPKTPLSPLTNGKAAGAIPTPLSSASPSKKSFPSTPSSTEASKLLREFFGEPTSPPPEYEIDTAAILMEKPSSEMPKVETLSCQIYQLSSGGKKTAVPRELCTLFEENLYFVVHTFKTASSSSKITEVYFWIGDEVPDSVVQDAEIFVSRDAKAAGGKLIVLHQGRESSTFFQALKGVVIIRRGTSSKYDSLAPYILCGRQYLDSIALDQVEFSPSSLSSGFAYIVNQGARMWLWKGKGSSDAEVNVSRALGLDLALMGTIDEVDEGSEPAEFLEAFGQGTRIRGGAGHWRLKPKYSGYCGRLFKIEVAKVTEISPFTQTSISPHNIYILDAFFEIYIIIGAYSGAIYPGASATAYGGGASSSSSNADADVVSQGNQYQAFHTALHFAQEYGILAAGMEDRPFVPVSTVVVEGMPRDARVVFRKWREGVVTTRSPDNASTPDATSNVGNGLAAGGVAGLQRGRSLRVVPLMAALEATRG